MKARTWIERLEKRYPKRQTEGDSFEPDFDFRVAGLPRSEVQRRSIRLLKNAIADPRATVLQREQWQEEIKSLEAALNAALEYEKKSTCPQ